MEYNNFMKLKVLDLQNNSDSCVVCGLENKLGLHAHFYVCENDTLVGVCTPRDEHQSYPDRMHGGLICALLDETLGRAVQITHPDDWGVTGNISVKYRKPTPLNATIYCVARITKMSTRGFSAYAFIEDEAGNLLSESEAMYVKIPKEKLTNGYFDDHSHWFLDNDAKDYKYFDIKNIDLFDKLSN